MSFTDSRVEPENDTKAKPEMTDGFDTGPSRARSKLRCGFQGRMEGFFNFLANQYGATEGGVFAS